MMLLLYLFAFLYKLQSIASAEGFIYPEYCSKVPLDASKRQSPPLDVADQNKNLELVQLHIILRHGARTPSGYQVCWNNYDPRWDCSYNEAGQGVQLPDPLRNGSTTFVFRKVFDADPNDNVFGGTCQKGQLISEGAMQHRQIGQYFASSYLISESNYKIPTKGSPPLLSAGDDLSKTVFFRSTDMQRTRLSAANLLSSALRTAFPDKKFPTPYGLPILHTMDLEHDDMFINPTQCPLIEAVAQGAYHSDGYLAIERDHEALLKRLTQVLGSSMETHEWPAGIQDCLLSHICADRWDNIPDALNPNGSDPTQSQQFIDEIVKAVEVETAYLSLWNDSSFSKHGIGHFMVLLRSKIFQLFGDLSSLPKLSIWSGHDTTLAPFLASFGPKVFNGQWPPYASTVALEFFRTPDLVFLFRLVSNGEVLTGGVEGCDGKNLCEIEHLMSATAWADGVLAECQASKLNGTMNRWDNSRFERPPWPIANRNEANNNIVSFLFNSSLATTLAFITMGALGGALIMKLKHQYSQQPSMENLSRLLL